MSNKLLVLICLAVLLLSALFGGFSTGSQAAAPHLYASTLGTPLAVADGELMSATPTPDPSRPICQIGGC